MGYGAIIRQVDNHGYLLRNRTGGENGGTKKRSEIIHTSVSKFKFLKIRELRRNSNNHLNISKWTETTAFQTSQISPCLPLCKFVLENLNYLVGIHT